MNLTGQIYSFSISILILTGCSSTLEPVEDELLSDEQILVSTTWREDAWNDAYNGIWVESTVHDDIFVFNADKTYEQEILDTDFKMEGTWQFANQNTELILSFMDPVRGPSDLVYHVSILSPDTLQIASPGRHGPVTRRYLPYSER